VRTPREVLVLVWMAWAVSWWAAAVWRDRAASKLPRSRQIGYRALAVAGALLLFGPYRHAYRSEIPLWRTPEPAGWVCVGGVAAGLAFTWWARLHLGRLWSSSVGSKAQHRVVDTGPYGIVRHPIYTGITFASLATAAMRGTVGAFAGAAIMTAGWIVKARLEEQFLRQQLGAEAYDAYARRVPMLVPFLR
jgi:protein-S-isoprenylcysteine O-methyltransferase Ste14